MKFRHFVAALLGAVSSQVLAQPAPPPVQDAEAAQSDAPGLEDIVVTANRREERLQNVPISVSAAGGQQLESASITNPTELTRVVPSLTITRTTTNIQPVIRGVSFSGTGPGSESNIATYVDGVYIPDQAGGFFDLGEIDRVEVLRGPQGTLFGRNATGGLINIITKDPKFELGGNVRVSYGRFDEYRARGYITGPIADTLAADLAIAYSNADGWIKDGFRGGKLNPSETFSVRSKVLWKPVEDGKITFSFSREHSDDTSSSGFYLIDGNTIGRARNPSVVLADGPFDASYNQKPALVTQATRGNVQTEWQLGGVTLATISAFSHSKALLEADAEFSPVALQSLRVRQSTKTLSNEVRLFGSSGSFDWIVGAFQFLNRARATYGFYAPDLSGTPALFLSPRIRTTSYAAFGEGTYHITEDLSAIFGLRYTYEKVRFAQSLFTTQLFSTSTQNRKWSPRASLRYTVSPRVNVYATFSQGFKGGGYNPAGTVSDAVRPEELTSYEIGMKADPTSWLRVNGALYYYDFKNLQVTARNAAELFVLQNAASARIKGGELEVTARPVRELTLRGSVAYMDGHYRNFKSAQNFIPNIVNGVAIGGNISTSPDVSGNQVQRAPKFSFGVGGSYTVPVGEGEAGVSADLFHSSRVYWSTDLRYFQKPYELVNGEIFWAPNEMWRFSVWGKNLTNAVVARQFAISANASGRVNDPPRTFGVAAKLSF